MVDMVELSLRMENEGSVETELQVDLRNLVKMYRKPSKIHDDVGQVTIGCSEIDSTIFACV
jgi:hypothetical protein